MFNIDNYITTETIEVFDSAHFAKETLGRWVRMHFKERGAVTGVVCMVNDTDIEIATSPIQALVPIAQCFSIADIDTRTYIKIADIPTGINAGDISINKVAISRYFICKDKISIDKEKIKEYVYKIKAAMIIKGAPTNEIIKIEAFYRGFDRIKDLKVIEDTVNSFESRYIPIETNFDINRALNLLYHGFKIGLPLSTLKFIRLDEVGRGIIDDSDDEVSISDLIDYSNIYGKDSFELFEDTTITNDYCENATKYLTAEEILEQGCSKMSTYDPSSGKKKIYTYKELIWHIPSKIEFNTDILSPGSKFFMTANNKCGIVEVESVCKTTVSFKEVDTLYGESVMLYNINSETLKAMTLKPIEELTNCDLLLRGFSGYKLCPSLFIKLQALLEDTKAIINENFEKE